MFRSLHMKLVLIMVLLTVSLMMVVGVFLMNAVVMAVFVLVSYFLRS